jgi:hypothetical protein
MKNDVNVPTVGNKQFSVLIQGSASAKKCTVTDLEHCTEEYKILRKTQDQ